MGAQRPGGAVVPGWLVDWLGGWEASNKGRCFTQAASTPLAGCQPWLFATAAPSSSDVLLLSMHVRGITMRGSGGSPLFTPLLSFCSSPYTMRYFARCLHATGGIKRWGFARGNMTHGSKSKREHGSTGPGSTPGRVFPGLKAAGQMGNVRAKLRKVEVRTWAWCGGGITAGLCRSGAAASEQGGQRVVRCPRSVEQNFARYRICSEVMFHAEQS